MFGIKIRGPSFLLKAYFAFFIVYNRSGPVNVAVVMLLFVVTKVILQFISPGIGSGTSLDDVIRTWYFTELAGIVYVADVVDPSSHCVEIVTVWGFT